MALGFSAHGIMIAYMMASDIFMLLVYFIWTDWLHSPLPKMGSLPVVPIMWINVAVMASEARKCNEYIGYKHSSHELICAYLRYMPDMSQIEIHQTMVWQKSVRSISNRCWSMVVGPHGNCNNKYNVCNCKIDPFLFMKIYLFTIIFAV